MAAEKGSAFLLKVGNGGSPVSFTTVGGCGRRSSASMARQW